MRAPSAERLVRVWEWGKDKHPVDRALGLLAEATDTPRDTLARLDIARRDRLLLELRMALIGERLEVKSACPACETDVEFEVPAKQLLLEPPSESGGSVRDDDGVEVRYRYPNSLDLAAVADAATEDEGLRLLVARCVEAGPREALSSELVARIADTMREEMPQSDIRFDLGCPACEARWKTTLDIAGFLWTEVESEVRRLLRDTADIALRYGWSEQEILRMSPERRRFYLEMDG